MGLLDWYLGKKIHCEKHNRIWREGSIWTCEDCHQDRIDAEQERQRQQDIDDQAEAVYRALKRIQQEQIVTVKPPTIKQLAALVDAIDDARGVSAQ